MDERIKQFIEKLDEPSIFKGFEADEFHLIEEELTDLGDNFYYLNERLDGDTYGLSSNWAYGPMIIKHTESGPNQFDTITTTWELTKEEQKELRSIID